MSKITVSQIIMDAQRMASRVKDLDSLSSTLLVEAEGNNRMIESLRQFQDDIEALNRISSNKSNAEMVNRIQQQNAQRSEILKENRELKVCIEDYERALDMIMHKYREHASSKVMDNKINFNEFYNEKLWNIIKQQREKINEMAAVMQRAASIDDESENSRIENMSRLRMENKSLRELLQISQQFNTSGRPIRFNEHLLEEKGVQTECEDYDDLSLSNTSIETTNNNCVMHSCNTNLSLGVCGNSFTTLTMSNTKPDTSIDNNNLPSATLDSSVIKLEESSEVFPTLSSATNCVDTATTTVSTAT